MRRWWNSFARNFDEIRPALKEEFDALSVRFEDRGAMTHDYIRAMRALLTEEAPCFEGRFVRLRDASMRPKPMNGTVPIVLAGHSKAAARRSGRADRTGAGQGTGAWAGPRGGGDHGEHAGG